MARTPDCLILGGGIAGLWILRRLLSEGFDAALVETDALGSGQTIASQGIIHAGTKYALTGQAAGASRAAAEAAAVWRTLLPLVPTQAAAPHAAHDPDLSSTTVLSPHTYMFTTPGIASRLSGLAASRALISGPRKLHRAEYPPAFLDAPNGVDLYRLDEPVLDLPSLIDTLAAPARPRLIHAAALTLAHDRSAPGGIAANITTTGGELSLTPRALVCAAGAGNGPLLAKLGLTPEIPMQRRPLHMAMARFPAPGPGQTRVYAHCVTLSDKPRATITAATDATGRAVWYIGGQLAEDGVGRSREDQVAAARAELTKIVPWIDTGDAEFATHPVDRAEGFDQHGRRPDTPVVRRHGPVIACWPTKLVLAPLAADLVREELSGLGIAPSGRTTELPPLPPPQTATPVWDREDLAWS